MEKIKIDFVDFYPHFKKESNELYDALIKRFPLEISPNPDYLIYSCYGNEHLKYKCVKIFFTGENLVPDFNFCDYAIGFHFLNFEDRYIRLPLAVIRKPYQTLRYKQFDKEKVLQRKFCNFVYSNQGNFNPVRNKFFLELSKYKKVDSGGKVMNNIGGPVIDKLAFIADYKFTIAFENSSVNGYVTEKIIDPMSVNSVPIYWGSKSVDVDFNTDSFILVRDDNDAAIREAIDKIIYYDTHDDAYIELLSQPWLKPQQYVDYEKELCDFFQHIVEQPYDKAFRRAMHGYNMRHVERATKVYLQSKDSEISFKEMVNLFFKKVKRKLKLS